MVTTYVRVHAHVSFVCVIDESLIEASVRGVSAKIERDDSGNAAAAPLWNSLRVLPAMSSSEPDDEDWEALLHFCRHDPEQLLAAVRNWSQTVARNNRHDRRTKAKSVPAKEQPLGATAHRAKPPPCAARPFLYGPCPLSACMRRDCNPKPAHSQHARRAADSPKPKLRRDKSTASPRAKKKHA